MTRCPSHAVDLLLLEFRAANLDGMPGFTGLNIPRTDGKINPVTDLFRTDWPGVTADPIVFQLLLNDFIIDAIVVEPKQVTLVPQKDYMTSFQAWLDVQVTIVAGVGNLFRTLSSCFIYTLSTVCLSL